MSQDKKGNGPKQKPSPKGQAAPKAPPAPVVVAPLFRKVDWLGFWLVTLLVFAGYFLTLAPDVTLEDSGELAVGSYYAGVPHPPGYPVWTIITWLFTELIPFSNVAWRVSLASAVAGAFACGLLAMVVSRGSSMMIEGIALFKGIAPALENRLCFVAGLVGGLLMGFNGYMWSQAVIVEVYTMSVLSLMLVITFLLRWLYAPHQRKYLYLAFFFFGICLTNHMSVLVAAMGIQIAVAAVNPRIGRDMFAVNTILWAGVLLLRAAGRVAAFDNNTPLFVIFNVIGISSLAGCVWLAARTSGLGTEWRRVLMAGLAWGLGTSFYLYMPVASMTNPPMNWGYPRTAEGFMHALKRGQYESVRPTSDPVTFGKQVMMYAEGAADEFTVVCLLIGLLPFLFYRFMQRREKAWIIGLASIYAFLAFLLLILLNPGFDRQSQSLVKVFFTASHALVAIGIGYGVALAGAYLLTQYQTGRRWILGGAAAAAGLGLVSLIRQTSITFADLDVGVGAQFIHGLRATLAEGQNFWPVSSGLLLLGLSVAFLVLVVIGRERVNFNAALVVLALLPLPMIMLHWEENEQRGHRFGYWFGHDMFTPPFSIYPEMERDAILFGGTDPGRFNPTYMIFCESFMPPRTRHNPEFDRRDVYLITQNALADKTYLEYIRAHYNRSAQMDPPFFQEFFKTGVRPLDALIRPPMRLLDWTFLSIGERVEKRRRAGTSYFEGEDLVDLEGLSKRLRERADGVSEHLYGELSEKTRGLLEGGGRALRRELARDLNRVLDAGLLHDAERFKGIELSERTRRFVKENPEGHTRIRLNRLLLEEAFPSEIAKSPGGVYPDLEIHTPTPEDSDRAFIEYSRDFDRRLALNQLKPGETYREVDGRRQITGTAAVMSLNAILTKVIFDKNPDHEFYVEESFPLDWMFPHLTPHGIIMKINREPPAELGEEILARDHEFWREYSERLIGNWVTYDTAVSEIAEFAERVYLRRDYREFGGDRKFIRDDNAQKAFSKLRGSIGGVYSWRLSGEAPPQFRPKTSESQQLLLREAEFALKQAWAFCPYMPETVLRYIQLLVPQNRMEDAVLVVETALKFDPRSDVLHNLLSQLGKIQAATGGVEFQEGIKAAYTHMQQRQTNEALAVLDQLMMAQGLDSQSLIYIANLYMETRDFGRTERALQRLVQVSPESPEAWFDLAATQAVLGRADEALRNLGKAVGLGNARRLSNPRQRDIAAAAREDVRFSGLRHLPEFQRLMQGQ